jgi:pilus assembly protein CpaD
MIVAAQTRTTQATHMHVHRTIARLPSAGRRSRIPAIVLAGGLLAALAGCSSTHEKLDPFTTNSVVADDYRITHAITPQEQTVAIEIPVSAYARTLTDGEKGNIAFFVQKFQASGAALIGIAVPSGSPNQASAGRIASQIQVELANNGIPSGVVRKGAYRADPGDAIAPVRLAYRAVVAATDPCGSWPDLVSSNEQNRHFHNYGCATQQNLAAEVENPLDLEYPRGTTPPDATRRADVLLKYRQGEKVNGDYSAETGGAVATGVGQ